MGSVLKILTMALLLSALSFAAIIDDFSTAQGLNSDSTLDATPATATSGIRSLVANLTGGAGSVSNEVAGGWYLGNLGSVAQGQTGAVYTSLWNLTSGSASGLAIEVLGLEGYTGGSIQFSIRDTDGDIATYSTGVTFLGLVVAPYSLFTNIGAINLASVNQVGFLFTHDSGGPSDAQDIVLDNFQTYVPEPGTYAMMAVGLLGLFAIRRKKA